MFKFSSTLCAALAALGASSFAIAADAPAGYDKPPQNILDVMRAPSPPTPIASPTRQSLLLVSWQDYPSISRVATPFLKLAGARVEPANHSKHDTPGGYGITPCATGFDLVRVADGQSTKVTLPAGVCANRPVWSADGKRFAWTNTTRDAVELWIGDAATATVRRVPKIRLNPMLDGALQWLPDQKSLLVKTVPAGLGAPPAEPTLPPGPSIQQSDGSKGQSSTYETRDTLANPHDEDLFDYYVSTQLARVDASTLAVMPIGKPGAITSASAAPDGRHLLVTTLHKPYSYVVTYQRFPREVEVWDLAAKGAPAVRKIASIPLADRVPIAGVRKGPRDFDWRPAEPATLVWAEALDEGDWNVQVPNRDKVMALKAPFAKDAAVEVARTVQRFEGFMWGERADTALMVEYDENRHWLRIFNVDLDHPQNAPRLWQDRSSEEKYADPGNPVLRQRADGEWLVRQDGDTIYMSGVGASPDGDRPFLDRTELSTGKTQRLFRSERTAYESFVGWIGSDAKSFLTWHQSPNDPPNAFVRTLEARVADTAMGEAAMASKAVALTHLPDTAPAVRAIKKRLVKYKRADGLDLSFTLYTPPGYVEGQRVPTILYAYPLDYADASKAGQVSGSQATFTRLRQYRLLLLAGYAIIDNASFPVIGDPKKAYDDYLPQLVADAKAAVDKAVEMGVTDPERVGVTGHSHGALMTVNLIAHSDLFRAGIATSGSYNKTLTPFGFQNERRSVWLAPDVYSKVSPFFAADKIKTPLLLIHGMDDANPGTTPLQSVKLFEAVRGNGGTVRLVMLPHEPHWYTALESNEQEVFEMVTWFDKYVKNAKPRAAK